MTITIKYLSISCFITCLLLACAESKPAHEPKQITNDDIQVENSNLELTQLQESAFDALNYLQMNTDELDRLYSTFPNIQQPCYPAQDSFSISQADLQNVMEHFIKKHCKKMPVEEQIQLAKSSVQAQKNYKVMHCNLNAQDSLNTTGYPAFGIWVFPDILGRRDLILEW